MQLQWVSPDLWNCLAHMVEGLGSLDDFFERCFGGHIPSTEGADFSTAIRTAEQRKKSSSARGVRKWVEILEFL